MSPDGLSFECSQGFNFKAKPSGLKFTGIRQAFHLLTLLISYKEKRVSCAGFILYFC